MACGHKVYVFCCLLYSLMLFMPQPVPNHLNSFLHSCLIEPSVLMQWGGVEADPGAYEWSGYRDLFDILKRAGLKMQV